MKIISWEKMRRVTPPGIKQDQIHMLYATKGEGREGTENTSLLTRAERDRLKEDLSPYIKEQIRKILKEEQDYYKTRPSLAARYYGGMAAAVRAEEGRQREITVRVYARLEDRMRKEWLRKGRG